jgi:hypothetical protein
VTRPRVVGVLAALIAALLSSGLTVVYLHATAPELFAADAPLETAPELRDLAALLVPPDGLAATGPGRTMAVNGNPESGLAALGFTRGWSRAWAATDRRVDAYVLEFRDESGALAYARGAGRAARLLIKPVPFTVPDVPGATGLADTVRDRSGRYAQVVVLHRGRRAVLLVFSDRAPMPGTAVYAQVKRQYDALAAT